MSITPTRPETDVIDLPAAAAALLSEARTAKAGRAGRTLAAGAGAHLKQSLLALAEGGVLADHESPGEATLHVITGHVHLSTGGEVIDMDAGAWTRIPPVRHGVEAITDAVLLISVAPRQGISTAQPPPPEG